MRRRATARRLRRGFPHPRAIQPLRRLRSGVWGGAPVREGAGWGKLRAAARPAQAAAPARSRQARPRLRPPPTPRHPGSAGVTAPPHRPSSAGRTAPPHRPSSAGVTAPPHRTASPRQLGGRHRASTPPHLATAPPHRTAPPHPPHRPKCRTRSQTAGSATPTRRRKPSTPTSRSSSVSRKLRRPRASPTAPGGNAITPGRSSWCLLVIFAIRALSPRTDNTRQGRSFEPGPSSYGTSAHQISPARGARSGARRRGSPGRAGGRVRPSGRRPRPRPSTTAATSASTTTAASATHQDMSMPPTVPAPRPPRALRPNR